MPKCTRNLDWEQWNQRSEIVPGVEATNGFVFVERGVIECRQVIGNKGIAAPGAGNIAGATRHNIAGDKITGTTRSLALNHQPAFGRWTG